MRKYDEDRVVGGEIVEDELDLKWKRKERVLRMGRGNSINGKAVARVAPG